MRTTGAVIASAVFAIAVIGCSSAPSPGTSGTAGAGGSDGQAVAQDVSISMQRLPCFGTCPVYTVRVDEAGVVGWTGDRHVTTTGEAAARVPADSVQSLVREIEAAGYFGFAESYEMNAPACGSYHTDAPRVITTVRIDSRSRTITHDYGCGGAPAALRDVHDAIDRVTGTARWIGAR